MFGNGIERWAKGAAVVGLVLLALVLAGGQPVAAFKCKKVSGKVTLQPLPPEACLSSISLCASGALTGDLAGESIFAGSSLVPTVDTPMTSVVLLTGDSSIDTKDGNLLAKNAIVLQTTGAGAFAEVDTVISGTGRWAGASGQFTATGAYDATAGGSGTYSGEICRP